MKKSLVMLPLVALALSACSSNSNPDVPAPAPVVSVPAPAWQSQDIQPVQMPSAMTQPAYQAAQQAPLPSYQAPQPPVYSTTPTYPAVAPVATPAPAPAPAPAPSVNPAYSHQQIGHCRIVRDSANTPVYNQMQKGCYTDATYTVSNKGETIFFISFLAGKPHSEIARLNHLVEPYALKMGQVLRLR